MNIIIDLLPWEPLFIGSALALCATGIAGGIALLRRRPIGFGRQLCLALFALGAILPWLSQPNFAARLRQGMQTNIADTRDASPWPELQPRRYQHSSAVVAEAAAQTFARLGWRLVDRDAATLAAEVPIAFGLFTDDLRVILTAEANQTIINARSSSRVGRGDFGENRRHVLQFFTELEQQFGAASQPTP